MNGIFHRNIAFMLVSIVVILIMASLNAPSLSTNNGSIRPRLNSPRLEAVVVAEVDVAAEVTLLVEAVALHVGREGSNPWIALGALCARGPGRKLGGVAL